MNLVSEQLAREHLDELRREAARYAGRAAARADRARPGRRVAGGLLRFSPHRRPAVGCEA